MEPIRTIGDLLAAGAHWIARSLQEAGRGVAAFSLRLRERFGPRMEASRPTIDAFYRLTLRSAAAARLVESGIDVPLTAVPLVETGLTSQQFLTQGIVDLSDESLGEPGKPFQATLPFQRQSSELPTIDRLRQELNQAVASSDVITDPQYQKNQKRRERAQFVRDRGRNVQYDITPFFVWRTH